MFEFIEQVVYINLDHRKDRREQIEKELIIFGEKVQRFDAVYEPKKGHLGCSKSHIEVLKLAIKSGWKNYLVVEDDAVFDLTGYSTLEDLISKPYDVIVLGGTALSFNKAYQCYNSCCTTAYIVSETYYQTLLSNLEEGAQKLEKEYHNSDHYAIDQYWNILHRRDNWYVVYPPLVSQRSDYSDINGHFVDKTGRGDDILNMNVKFLTVQLQGGLGNQLFQLGFLLYLREQTSNYIFIDSLQSPESYHSNKNYFDSIFSKWKPHYNNKLTTTLYENPKLAYEDWNARITPEEGNLKIHGYFQHFDYYSNKNYQNMIDSLTFDESVLQKYPDISSKFFIHVRGGDYLGNSLHFVDLKDYYARCMCNHPKEKYVIFTNDVQYARSLFPSIQIIQESEVDTLLLMSKTKGCICANSSFSWWGAFLNPNRTIYFPSKWFNDPSMDTTGLYFKESKKVETDAIPKIETNVIPEKSVKPYRLSFLRRK